MKTRILLKTFIFTFLFITTAFANGTDSIKNHIDSALQILKTKSLYANKINWDDLRERVQEKASTARTKADSFEALKIAFDALNDKHAIYYHYSHKYQLIDEELNKRYSDSIKAAWKLGPRVISKMLGEVGYINVPYMGAGKQADIDLYANMLNDAVQKLALKKPKGWIIDLRLNGGGNIRPMLAGLSSFFKDQVLGYYVDRDGTIEEQSSIKNGQFLLDNKLQANLKNSTSPLQKSKVAVLIGPGTGSSGEGVAADFKQRPRTKLFGEVTAGRANSTNGFIFGDDAYFLISTSSLADRKKRILPESVQPDIYVKANDAFNSPYEDFVVSAALKWLN